jgi:hypothetical protein
VLPIDAHGRFRILASSSPGRNVKASSWRWPSVERLLREIEQIVTRTFDVPSSARVSSQNSVHEVIKKQEMSNSARWRGNEANLTSNVKNHMQLRRVCE